MYDFFSVKGLLKEISYCVYHSRALCVQRNATHEEIKGNYRKLARLVHPDKCELKDADEAFKSMIETFLSFWQFLISYTLKEEIFAFPPRNIQCEIFNFSLLVKVYFRERFFLYVRLM